MMAETPASDLILATYIYYSMYSSNVKGFFNELRESFV